MKKREGQTVRAARAREEEGDLAGAVQLFVEAGLGDEAARVLLLRADAESSIERRVAFCAQAANRAESDQLRRAAHARKALTVFDNLKRSGATFLRNEVLAVAAELELAEEFEAAAEAFAMGGDTESEIRVLASAGEIERMEERLRVTEVATKSQRDGEARARRFEDLDRTGERRAALALAAEAPEDPKLAELARVLRGRVATGPIVSLEIDGAVDRYALGDEVIIGRSDATIVVASRAISRQHLRVVRGPDGPSVEDLGTRNGTFLAGARVASRLPVGAGIDLRLGGEVPCSVTPARAGGVIIDVRGERLVAPLGPLTVPSTQGGWRVVLAPSDGLELVSLLSDGAVDRPLLGPFELGPSVELAYGDEIVRGRGGVVALRVPLRDRPLER